MIDRTATPGIDMARLPVGAQVRKVTGYPFHGEIRSAFTTTAGQERFVVEATGADYAGMLHIFNGDQLRVVEACRFPDCDCGSGAFERCDRPARRT